MCVQELQDQQARLHAAQLDLHEAEEAAQAKRCEAAPSD